MKAEELWEMSRSELHAQLAKGHPIDPSALHNRAYKGVSLGLGSVVDRLLWKTFMKTFLPHPTRGLVGWNVRLQQRGLYGSVAPMVDRAGVPKTFGHYRVVSAAGAPVPGNAQQGLVLDYSPGGENTFDPTRTTRDVLVAVEPGNADLLLGWLYVVLPGGKSAGSPSYFTLQFEEPLGAHRPEPPRWKV